MDAFIGEIRLFPYTYAPQDWQFCNGALLQIHAFQALYSLLGTRFGGDGKTTFGLPNLQGQTVLSAGADSQGNIFQFAGKYGQETVTLSAAQIPTHRHVLNALLPPASTATGATATPVAGQSMLARPMTTGNAVIPAFLKPPLPSSPAPTAIGMQVSPAWGNTGGGVDPHSNMMPYLTMGFYICAENGAYPFNPN